MKKLLSLVVLFLGLAQVSEAGIGASTCLWLDTIHINPDSTYIDTCHSSATFQKMFCRKGYELHFNWYVINSPVYNTDTSLLFDWTAIDTAFPAIRSAFASLDSLAGHFTIYKNHAYISDTSSELNKFFILRFDSLLDVDSALSFLTKIPGVTVNWSGAPAAENDIPNVNSLIPGLDFSKISLDGSTTFTRYLHPLGWQWNIYVLHCPMAWEITKGKRANGTPIHVVGADQFDGIASSNPDLTPNFVQNVVGTPGPGQEAVGDGFPSDPLKDGHGHVCLSEAISAGVKSMIGTCPECEGIALNWYGTKPYQIDVDGIADGHKTVPEVEWSSASGLGSLDFTTGMNSGIVISTAAGNDVNDVSGESFHDKEPDPLNPSHTLWFPQVLDWQGYPTFIDGGSDPTKDVHPLAIGGTVDGISYGPNAPTPCIEYAVGTYPRMVGPEEFDYDYNFSCGVDKFSTSTVVDTRIQRKRWAFMDAVAPAEIVMDGGAGTVGYGESSGTSLSAPMVAGIAGLMRSINYYVKIDGTSPNSAPSDLANVQRNANNIITFTSDKIHDYSNWGFPRGWDASPSQFLATGFPSSVSDNAYTSNWLDPQGAGSGNWQYSYVNQTNDPLNRSWAQRVGFGRVNAYRAVANSIPCIGAYSYSASNNNLFSGDAFQNENGQYLMHFGAWKDATHKTLDVGGNIIPNQSPAWPHYNQGQTLINSSGGSATVLTVGESPNPGNKDILAIDGNLIGDNVANNKITSTANGKVLLTGYLRDVEITGDTTKVDDEIIDGTSNDGYSKIEVDANEIAEIYGVVHLQNYGNFVVNGGNLTIQPGGEIDMDGNNDFEITSGTVTMEASTKISSSARSVIVDNGANLVIAGLLPVDMLCMLHVRTGGTVTIDAGAHLRLDRFTIDKAGTLTVLSDNTGTLPGGRLTLNKTGPNNISNCLGNLLFNGVSNSRCTLTGGVSMCGIVDQNAFINVQGSMINATDVEKTQIAMVYTDDSDVGLDIVNARKSSFFHDYFSINSDWNHYPDFSIMYPLEIWNTSLLPGITLSQTLSGADFIALFTTDVTYCHFFDEKGAYTEDQLYPSWHIFDAGLHLYNQFTATVGNNYFYNSRIGCISENSPHLTYESNVFGQYPDGTASPMNQGIVDVGCGVLYCSNTISNCGSGALRMENLLLGTLHDNTFNFDTTYCLIAQYGTVANLWNNTFNSYQGPAGWVTYGAWAAGNGSTINMTDQNSSPAPIEYGRNHFNDGSPIGNPSYDLVRGVDFSRFSGLAGGTLIVECGQNYFSQYSQYHIFNCDPGNYSISVDNNEWDNPTGPPFLVRHIVGNVTPGPGPLNISATVIGTCATVLDWSPICLPSSAGPGKRDETWSTLPDTSLQLKTSFTGARGSLLSDTNDFDTRRSVAMDELWAGSLVDSAATYVPLALNDFSAVIADPFASDTVKSAMWGMKARVFEMLGNQDSAVFAYDTILAHYHQFSDSVFAQWGIQRDTISSNGTDTALLGYSDRVQADIYSMMDTASAVGGGYKIATHSIAQDTASLLMTVHPNPSSNYTRICVPDLPAGNSGYAYCGE